MMTESLSQQGSRQPLVNTLPDPTSASGTGQHAALPQQDTGSAAGVTSSDDDDMSIEKECIDKAKAIVQQTSSDPFLQAKELSKVKAELLKRRYGKELKISEG